MFTKKIATVAMALAATAALTGFVAAQRMLTFTPASRIWVDGTSTVRSFQCEAGAPDGKVALSGPIASLAEVAAAAQTAKFTIKTAAMDCKNDKMNEHMLKALKAEDAPEITFAMKSVLTESTAEGVWTARITGELTMAGTTRLIEVAANATLTDGAIRLQGVAPINMKEWGIKPPSLMLGTMKVGENVKVNFDVVLEEAS